MRGYDSIISSQFVAYMRAAYPQSRLSTLTVFPRCMGGWTSPRSSTARFQLLGVRYLVMHLDTELNATGWTEVYS
ncbi:MAG: hypothetical protein HND48_06035 [Chloroflexi bacterium]|nr:hypothetical protein [Chloroflexota bacterium]